LEDFSRVLETGTAAERAAAVLALRYATDADARGLLDRHAAFRDVVAARGVDWTTVLAFN
jgi:DNA-binding GntR family transcriptional regulator